MFLLFYIKGRIRNGDTFHWLIPEIQVLDTFLKVGVNRIFDKKVIIKNIFFSPQYKSHILSGTNDIQAIDNKQMAGRRLL